MHKKGSKIMKTQTVQAVLRFMKQHEHYSDNDAYNLAKFKCTKEDIKKVSACVWALYGFDRSKIKLSEVVNEVKNA